jgi:hypothetical protein
MFYHFGNHWKVKLSQFVSITLLESVGNQSFMGMPLHAILHGDMLACLESETLSVCAQFINALPSVNKYGFNGHIWK